MSIQRLRRSDNQHNESNDIDVQAPTPGKRTLLDLGGFDGSLYDGAPIGVGKVALSDSLPVERAPMPPPTASELVAHLLELLAHARAQLQQLVVANRARDTDASAKHAQRVRHAVIRCEEVLVPIRASLGREADELRARLDELQTQAAPHLQVAFHPPGGALWELGAPSQEDAAARRAWQASTGEPLPEEVQSKMERAFNADFSTVRIHEDERASQVGAQAFAQGENLHFAPKQYDPFSQQGQELLGHELAHVVQQREGRASTAMQGKGAIVADPALEAEADEMGARAARGERTGASAGGPASTASGDAAIQRKGPEPDVTAAFNIVHDTQPFPLLGGKVSAKWKVKGSASAKRAGNLSTKHGTISKTTVGANEGAIERVRGQWDAKLKSTVLKNVTTLDVADWIFDVDIPLTVTIDTRGIEAALTVRKLDLKLMSVFVKLEGDFTPWFDGFHVKGEAGIEIVLGADLSKLILEAATAADDQLKVAEYEKKLAGLERKVGALKKGHIPTRTPEGPPMDPDQLAKHRRELQRELDQLRGMRGKMNELRERSIEKLKTVAQNMEKLPGGKLAKKLGGKALSTVFKKFLPIYNVISTAQDLYEAADFLLNLNWSGIGEKILDGDGNDGQATVMGDGSVNEAGTGIACEGESDVASDGPQDAAGFQRELDARENVELHSSAAAVLGSLIVKDTIAGRNSAPIPDDEKRLLNATIPEDLTEEEIEEMSSLVAQAGATQTTRVTAAIEALRVVRPSGERKSKPAGADDISKAGSTAPNRDEPSGQDKATKLPKQSRETPPRSPVSGTWIVDPAETLRKVITIDEKTRQPVVPSEVAFPGFTADVRVIGVAQASWDGGGEGAETTFIVKVTITPRLVEARGTMLEDGRSVKERVPLHDIAVDAVRTRRSAAR
jgi:hypothetical protein